ncbi:hypothetical protein ILUMI_23475 [Ignelater luminosus]|uniref:Retroviral polymerase SH3-like domain-containing protein n=1 Tax=Ignelater luminosus TaxID=2038154 RepID=A0A8K0CEM3_IGNLU|nr:hypothetical protein ILUMI_23475 [Ignelater luminosus]
MPANKPKILETMEYRIRWRTLSQNKIERQLQAATSIEFVGHRQRGQPSLSEMQPGTSDAALPRLRKSEASKRSDRDGKVGAIAQRQVEAARTVLHSKNQEKLLWVETINSVVSVLNRVGDCPIKDQTSFELWYDKEPNVATFKELDFKVNVHISKEKRRTLDAIFVRYNPTVKGYKVYFPKKDKVEIHRDIVFITEELKGTEDSEHKQNEKIITLGMYDNKQEQ